MKKAAIVVDATCDLPQSFLDEHDIQIIPVIVKQNNKEFHDVRELKATSEFYRTGKQSNIPFETVPNQSDFILEMFREKLVTKFASVLVVTTHEKRSMINHQIRETTFHHKDKFPVWRKNAGLDPKFKAKIIDSGNIFTGQGLLVFEILRLMTEKAIPVDNLHGPIELLKPKIETLVAINDLEPLRDQERLASSRGDGSGKKMGWVDFQLGKILNLKPIIKCSHGKFTTLSKEKGLDNAIAKIFQYTLKEVKSGLSRPVINVSYAGNLAEIRTNPIFSDFVAQAKERNIKILISMMSISGAINVGRGALSISYIKS